jgi:Fe-S-cluster containining protein
MGVIMPFLRKGKCNRCGACCKDKPMPEGWGNSPAFQDDVSSKFPEELSTRRGGGFNYGGDWNDPVTGYCKYLKEESPGIWICRLEVEHKKPLICQTFPVTPLHITDSDLVDCSFSFEEKTQEEIDDLLKKGEIIHHWQDTYIVGR